MQLNFHGSWRYTARLDLVDLFANCLPMPLHHEAQARPGSAAASRLKASATR